MKFVIAVFLSLVGACSLAFAGGQQQSAPSTGGVSASAPPVGTKLAVFVSIDPQVYFVQEIAGDLVSVHALVPPGVEPESYDPTPRQMAMLSQAQLYFAIGLPFETVLVPKIESSMKNITVVKTQAGVPLRTFSQHLAGSAVPPGGTDPHIWLAPELVKTQGKTIEEALAAADPAHAAEYVAGLKRLDGQMNALHRQIAGTLAGLSGRSFLVFHPAFGYFADEFGLKQISIESEGKAPGPKQLAGLIAEAKRLQVKMVFVEPQFDQSRAKVIADSIGARVVTIDPLAEDYVANLESVARQIKAALE